jgi:general secretion pathway protein I
MPERRDKQRGFSLIEVLVAFSILAISLAVILAIFSRGMRTAALSEDYRHAMMLADNKMTELLYVQPLHEGIASGEDQSFNWQTEVKRANDTSTSGIRHTQKRYLLNVQISWQEAGKQRLLSLDNLALQE